VEVRNWGGRQMRGWGNEAGQRHLESRVNTGKASGMESFGIMGRLVLVVVIKSVSSDKSSYRSAWSAEKFVYRLK
jgi:hypothetical protein